MASALEDLKLQFYIVSSILAFLVVVLISVVIYLVVQVRKLKLGVEDDEEIETNRTLPPPPVNSGFWLPKPNFSKNWTDDDADISRQNEHKEYGVPKPALSKSWQAYPGEKDKHQPKRNHGHDFRHDDNMSSNSYDDQKSPQFKNSGGAFRNPLSGHNDSENKYDYNDNRSDRQARLPGQKSGASFNQGGNDNHGYRRDFQRTNNYY